MLSRKILLLSFILLAAHAANAEYAVHAQLKVLKPVNLDAMNDAYQTVDVLAETDDFVEFEATLYPLRPQPKLTGNPDWRAEDASMTEFLETRPSADWDAGMQSKLEAELKTAGIDPAAEDDLGLVEKVSTWALHRSQFLKMFDTFFTYFPGGVPAVFPGLQQAFDRNKGDADWDARTQFEHEVLGKEMLANKTYGSCTSYAVYQTTILRALGVPTRMILVIPVVDASDPQQIALFDSGVHNAAVRAAVDPALAALGQSFSSHTFNEVFINHQWVRLNYDNLAQPILDRNYLGLMVHVNTFDDLSEVNLAETWGRRYGLQQRDLNFARSNPYQTIVVTEGDSVL